MYRQPQRCLGMLLALLLMLPLFHTGAVAEPITLPDDAALLELMFPGAPFEPLPNFFYTNQIIDPGYTNPNEYGNRDLYQVKETKRIGDQVLVVAWIIGAGHSNGFMNHAFAVYDLSTQAMAGETMFFHADKQDYLLTYTDGVAGFFCAGTTTYSGWEMYQGGHYTWKDNQWERAWPIVSNEEAYDAYWENRKAIIERDEVYGPGNVAIFTRVVNKESEEWDYTWEYEDFLDF